MRSLNGIRRFTSAAFAILAGIELLALIALSLRRSEPATIFGRFSPEYMPILITALGMWLATLYLTVHPPIRLASKVAATSEWLHKRGTWWILLLLLYVATEGWKLLLRHLFSHLLPPFSPAFARNLFMVAVLLGVYWVGMFLLLPGWSAGWRPVPANGESRGKSSRSFLIATAILALAIGIFARLLWGDWRYAADDAFITFRYSANLGAGHGPTYNPGLQPVEGYTTFLWMLIMTIPHLLSVDVVLFAKLVGVLSTLAYMAVTFMLVHHLVGFLDDEQRLFISSSAVLMLCTLPATSIHAVSGMETSFFTLWMITFLYLTIIYTDHPTKLGAAKMAVAALLMGLTRPEGNLVALVGSVITLLVIPQQHKGAFVAAIVLAYLLPGAIYFGWRACYYGHLLPLPFYVKVSSQAFLPGFAELREFIFYMALRIGVFIIIGLRCLNMRQLAATLSAGILVAFYSFISPVMGFSWRFYFPAVPYFFSIAAAGVAALGMFIQSHKNRVGRNLQGAFYCVTILIISFAFLTGAFDRLRGVSQDNSLEAHIALGRRLATYESLGASPLLATEEAGAIPYYSGWRTLDIWGLNDDRIALSEVYPLDYIVSSRPDLIVLVSQSADTFISPYPWGSGLYWAIQELGMGKLCALEVRSDYYLWVIAAPRGSIAEHLTTWDHCSN